MSLAPLVDPSSSEPRRAARERPPLPRPERARWQPLRLGLVELFHYDAEEFWFRDGHLLLRGNNGTGKSKVLALTLPFLLDASLSAVRVEPDGDRGKRMEWNLLMGGRYERRIGYTWLELGRRDEEGAEHYLTLGCGLSAVGGRPRVDAWHFLTDQRVGDELLLISPERTAISRERLAAAIEGRGQIPDTAREYRRAVDARLFGLGERYDGLIDTLIQLRQPQLSKKPDEQSLSGALSNALPELPRAVLEDVAEAMNQLAAYREELMHIEKVRDAVADFGKRYSAYARIQARRQARVLRQAQTEFDKQSQALSEARAQLTAASDRADELATRCTALEAQRARERAMLDELRSDPAMLDARRLEELVRASEACERELDDARRRLLRAREQLAHECGERARREQELEAARAELGARGAELLGHAAEAGIAADHERSVLPFASESGPQDTSAELRRELAALSTRRAGQVARVREQLRAWERLGHERDKVDAGCRARREDLERAQRDARAADQELAASAAAFLAAWRGYLEALRVLSLAEPEAGLAELAAWVESLSGEQPLLRQLEDAQRDAQALLAAEHSELLHRAEQVELEDDVLRREAEALHAGAQLTPTALPMRAREGREARPGAPLWELLEFREHVSAPERAGLEAAFEGAGLLDAWVLPEGHVLHPDTDDAWLMPGAPRARSLLAWLTPGSACKVDAARVEALLASIAAGGEDEADADSWLSPGGHFRLGHLRGAYHKPEAQYLGQAAREAARRRRLAEIGAQRERLAEQRQALAAARELLAARQAALARELRAAPRDDLLRGAHLRFAELEKQRRAAQDRLVAAESELSELSGRLLDARRALELDARDLALDPEPAALSGVERALADYRAAAHGFVSALEARARGRRELDSQHARERGAQAQAEREALSESERQRELDETCARRDLLRETVGAAVEALERRLHAAERAVRDAERALKSEGEALSEAREQRARCEQRALDGETTLAERVANRQAAVERLQGFARTGLLGVAAPELTLPEKESWTIDPALSLARQIEASLARVAAEDRDWTRIQDEIGRDYTSLGTALTALGQRAALEQTEFGLVVQIIYGNRSERPDLLEQQLAGEIEQRRGILSAQEREVLENHLQAEVAAYLQRLLREAEERVTRINEELKRRPTSTGVYFRLDWEPLPEGDGGAPVGLSAARARLLRRVADAWSPEDRRLVGEFLQLRIASERSADDSGPLVDHLARALDYRRWHRFRVKRWHDGAFRPLSGPASSGERALGLTVPLFAAASSFYESGQSRHAPRLVLLDEAFAGIDDEARAHCMALIREFDLDFVMTSEREWGCYATLPGVAICQIVRREGIDAVYVSRWTWDGQAKREAPDPERRFAAQEPP